MRSALSCGTAIVNNNHHGKTYEKLVCDPADLLLSPGERIRFDFVLLTERCFSRHLGFRGTGAKGRNCPGSAWPDRSTVPGRQARRQNGPRDLFLSSNWMLG